MMEKKESKRSLIEQCASVKETLISWFYLFKVKTFVQVFFIVLLNFVFVRCKEQNIKNAEGIYVGIGSKSDFTINLKKVNDTSYFFKLNQEGNQENTFIGVVNGSQEKFRVFNISSLDEKFVLEFYPKDLLSIDSVSNFLKDFKGKYKKIDLVPSIDLTNLYSENYYHCYTTTENVSITLCTYPTSSDSIRKINLLKDTKVKFFFQTYESKKEHHKNDFYYVSFLFDNLVVYGWVAKSDMFNKRKRLYIYKDGEIEKE